MNLRSNRLRSISKPAPYQLLTPTLDERAVIDRRKPAKQAWQDDEHLLQKSIVSELTFYAPRRPELFRLHAIPNGGQRSKATAGKLKAEGVKSGVPDLHLPIPCGGFHGLYIELKKAGGTPSEEQWDWMVCLHRSGFRVLLCNDPQTVVSQILSYLDQ